ncbi:cell division protein ZipA [Sediminicurvatus halobius]|uniref:Cell division protein ZipA n=1 Tax=Sediminicurvatus halobius TaxID=2182432 RepID=A0A2U2N3F2_9GAMM|nr:cell division protein ZipA [Spiribacter halobius]PWG63499.1 cell division protein ZipA [Spiribacter halobius]UEX79630.1 cell division protein ZipA [Spiribacter halobius]
MDELRWILLILGVVVIAGVYVYGRLQDWRHDGPPWRRRGRREQREPFADHDLSREDIESTLGELDELIHESETEIRRPRRAPEEAERAEAGNADPEHDPEPEGDAPHPEPAPAREPGGSAGGRPELAFSEEGVGEVRVRGADGDVAASSERRLDTRRAESAAEAGSRPVARDGRGEAFAARLRRAFRGEEGGQQESVAGTPSDPPEMAGEEKIVVLSVMAPEGEVYVARALTEALEDCGLRLNSQGIYQRTLDTRTGAVALYSAANILEPGTFDPEALDETDTPGVVLFLRLPGPFDGLAAFEQMLATARTLARQLGGQVLDGRRCDLTTQSIEHIREELLEYRRRAHLAARQAR